MNLFEIKDRMGKYVWYLFLAAPLFIYLTTFFVIVRLGVFLGKRFKNRKK